MCRVSFILLAPSNTSFTSLASGCLSLHLSWPHFRFRQPVWSFHPELKTLFRQGACALLPYTSTSHRSWHYLRTSIGHKLFRAPFLSDPKEDYCTDCLSMQSLHYISFQSASRSSQGSFNKKWRLQKSNKTRVSLKFSTCDESISLIYEIERCHDLLL